MPNAQYDAYVKDFRSDLDNDDLPILTWQEWKELKTKQEAINSIDKPCAAPGLISYRCKSRYGWIMIGAKDHDDAMREARRSSDSVTRDNLQIWNGVEYEPC